MRRSISSPTSAEASGAKSTTAARLRSTPTGATCNAPTDTLSSRVNGPLAQSDDARAFFRGELKTLDTDLSAALSRQLDRATALHIQDVRMQIARALDPTVQPAGSGAGRTPTEVWDDGLFDVTLGNDLCWPDYVVEPRRRN